MCVCECINYLRNIKNIIIILFLLTMCRMIKNIFCKMNSYVSSCFTFFFYTVLLKSRMIENIFCKMNCFTTFLYSTLFYLVFTNHMSSIQPIPTPCSILVYIIICSIINIFTMMFVYHYVIIPFHPQYLPRHAPLILQSGGCRGGGCRGPKPSYFLYYCCKIEKF